MKYRKKPAVIDAEQFLGTVESFKRLCDWAGEDFPASLTELGECVMMVIFTLEGNMEVRENDWVIKGVEGEFYPCKPTIFKKTYEAVK